MEIKDLNTTTLAYIGDAVYETYIRIHVLESGEKHADALHKKAIKYVSATGQAKAIKSMFDSLTEEEQSFVKRARNHKAKSQSKNASIVEYKWATAFEALVGKAHLEGDIKREQKIIEEAIKIIDCEEK